MSQKKGETQFEYAKHGSKEFMQSDVTIVNCTCFYLQYGVASTMTLPQVVTRPRDTMGASCRSTKRHNGLNGQVLALMDRCWVPRNNGLNREFDKLSSYKELN